MALLKCRVRKKKSKHSSGNSPTEERSAVCKSGCFFVESIAESINNVVQFHNMVQQWKQNTYKMKFISCFYWNWLFSFYYEVFTHSAFFYIPGILHKGCGENVFVCQQPPVITSVMGNGRRRSISCPSCNGLADGNKLLAPVALAAGIDGSLYVGDLNFVRRVYPSLNTTRVLELRYIRRISHIFALYFLIPKFYMSELHFVCSIFFAPKK